MFQQCTPRNRVAPRLWYALAALSLVTSVPTAKAHPLVDAAVEAADDGRFDDALSAFDDAWRADGLTRADVVRLLVERAIVRFALRANAELDQDLRWLVVLDPALLLPQKAPPQLRRRLDQIRAEPRAEASFSVVVAFTQTHTTFDASLSGLPDALVRTVRVSARPLRGAYQSADGRHVELPITRAPTVEWYADVIGPGGAVLLSRGSASSPEHAENLAAIAVVAADDSPIEQNDRRSRKGLWWGIGGGAAAIVLGTVLFVVVHDPSRDTYVGDPVFR